MRRFILAACLSLSLAGCSWLESQNFDVCVMYKGMQVCAGRHAGVWTFTAERPLAPEEQAEIKTQLGR